MNPYSYIMNNPLAGTDPSGYTSCADVEVGGSCKVGDIKTEDVENIQITKDGNAVVNTKDGKSFTVETSNGKDMHGAFQSLYNSMADTSSIGSEGSKSTLTGQSFLNSDHKGSGDDFSDNHFDHDPMFGDSLFDPDDPTFHHYDEFTPFCSLGGTGCSSDILNEVLDNFSYPDMYLSPAEAALDGRPVVAYVVNPLWGDTSDYRDYDVPAGRVIQLRLPSGGIQNVTMRDHALFFGTISRHVVERDGKLGIWTHGIGINKATSSRFLNKQLAESNDINGPKAFKALDKMAERYWRENYVK
ncbi:hypothetical protein [Pseudidiomarina donghaiensis]